MENAINTQARIFFFWGKQSLSCSHPPFHIYVHSNRTNLKKYKNHMKNWIRESRWNTSTQDKHRINLTVRQIEVNRQEQRVRDTVFRNGGRIISLTMSNTESWARANPLTKKLKASNLKHVFNASQSGVTLMLSM